MIHPKNSPNTKFLGTPKKGIWQFMNKVYMDHQAIIGHHINNYELEAILTFYSNHAKLLYSLK